MTATEAERAARYQAFDRWHGAYLDWQVEQFADFFGERILEVGCGIGGIRERLPADREIHSLDVEEDVLSIARARFPPQHAGEFQLLDISRCGEREIRALQERQFDTIVCMNVLEHIENDAATVRRMEEILVPGGRLLLLVPAHPCLFGEYDRLDGHFRRYNKHSLRKLVATTSMRIERLYYFNSVGALGWWWHYKVLRRSIHGEGQFRIMGKLIGLLRPLERRLHPPFGLSLICVLSRPAAP